MAHVNSVNALRGMSLFRNVSLRLLNDVVERHEAQTVAGEGTPIEALLLLLVLDGPVDVEVGDEKLATSRRIAKGTAYVADKQDLGSKRVRVRPAPDCGGRVRAIKRDLMTNIMGASPSLARSM